LDITPVKTRRIEIDKKGDESYVNYIRDITEWLHLGECYSMGVKEVTLGYVEHHVEKKQHKHIN
jgi:hypothetical protein